MDGVLGGFDPNAFMQIFTVIIGIMLLWAGITGKGNAYKSSYPEKVQPQIFAILRKFYLAIGAVMTIGSILEYTNAFGDAITSIIFWIYSGISLALVIAYIIIIKVKFGKVMK
ncbi:MAG: hypothetical protein IJP03_04120 [Christensenellaceae bacterium]|nr:hypothetical protein [Christensenellaceae bacterium]